MEIWYWAHFLLSVFAFIHPTVEGVRPVYCRFISLNVKFSFVENSESVLQIIWETSVLSV